MALSPAPLYSLEFATQVAAAIRMRFYLLNDPISDRIEGSLKDLLRLDTPCAQFYQLVVSLIIELLRSKEFYVVGENTYTAQQPYTGDTATEGLATCVDVDYVLNKVGKLEIPAIGDPLNKEYPSLVNFICVSLNSMYCVSGGSSLVYSTSNGIRHYYRDGADSYSCRWEGARQILAFDQQEQPVQISDKYWDSINEVYYKNSSQIFFNPVPMLVGIINKNISSQLFEESVDCGNTYITLSYSNSESNGRIQYTIQYDFYKYISYRYRFAEYDWLVSVMYTDVIFTDYSHGSFYLHNTSPFAVEVFGSAWTPKQQYKQTQGERFKRMYWSGFIPLNSEKLIKVPNCQNLHLLKSRNIQANSTIDIAGDIASLSTIPLSIAQPIQISGAESPELDKTHNGTVSQDYLVRVQYKQDQIAFVKYNIPF